MSERTKRSGNDRLDETCVLLGSDLCFWLSQRTGCGGCYIHSLRSDDQKKEAAGRWSETIAMVPQEFDDLHESTECQFCKKRTNKADGYGVFEMAHPDPPYAKGMFFGLGKKVRTPVGSLVSVQASVCPSCRRVFRVADMLQVVTLIVGLALGIILLMIEDFSTSLADLFMLMPVLFLVLMGVAGFYIGKFAQSAYIKKKQAEMKLDLAEIPVVALMLHRGWFFFQTTEDRPRVAFIRHKQFQRMLRKRETESNEEETEIPLDNMNI